MRLLSHHSVSRRRHVGGAVGGALIAATLISLLYATLLPVAAAKSGEPTPTTAELMAAFTYGWTRTALYALVVAAVPFWLLRSFLNRLGANLGALYAAGGALLTIGFMVAGTAAARRAPTATELATGAVVGLTIGASYWLIASRE